MRRHSNIIAACLMTLSAALAGLGCGSESGPSAACTAITSYTASTTTPLSFATDIYPIMANEDVNAFGCAQASCHGVMTPIPITPSGVRTLQFVFNPPDIAMAKTNLMMASVNLPAMPRVTASNVGNSMLAYKISGADGLACLNSRCTSGASVGTAPCGDPMPTAGTLSAADRIKILDWIAQGAAN